MSLSEKARTYVEIWQRVVDVQKTNGHEFMERMYNEQWVLLSDAQELVKENRILRDLLANHDDLLDKNCERKQKLQQTCGVIHSKLKFLDYEQYHGDLKQSLTPIVREINQLLEELLQK